MLRGGWCTHAQGSGVVHACSGVVGWCTHAQGWWCTHVHLHKAQHNGQGDKAASWRGDGQGATNEPGWGVARAVSVLWLWAGVSCECCTLGCAWGEEGGRGK